MEVEVTAFTHIADSGAKFIGLVRENMLVDYLIAYLPDGRNVAFIDVGTLGDDEQIAHRYGEHSFKIINQSPEGRFSDVAIAQLTSGIDGFCRAFLRTKVPG